MVQLHCPRCELSIPVRAEHPSPRICPRCVERAKVQVQLAATAMLRPAQDPPPQTA